MVKKYSQKKKSFPSPPLPLSPPPPKKNNWWYIVSCQSSDIQTHLSCLVTLANAKSITKDRLWRWWSTRKADPPGNYDRGKKDYETLTHVLRLLWEQWYVPIFISFRCICVQPFGVVDGVTTEENLDTWGEAWERERIKQLSSDVLTFLHKHAITYLDI